MDAATAKAETKRFVEEQKYKRFLEESNSADLSDVERLGLISCQGTDFTGRRIVTFALGLKTRWEVVTQQHCIYIVFLQS